MSLGPEQLGQLQGVLRANPTPWLRTGPSNSPLARKARTHLRRAVELLEEDVARSGGSGGGSGGDGGGGGGGAGGSGSWRTQNQPLPSIARGKQPRGGARRARAAAVDNSDARSTTSSNASTTSAFVRAAAAASAQRREQRQASGGTATAAAQAGPSAETAALKQALLKLEAFLKHNMLRGMDMLKWSEKHGAISRSEGPFMCWLTNLRPSPESNFSTAKLRVLLQREIAVGDLRMRASELDLVMAKLDDGRGQIDYQQLRRFTTSSYVHRLGTDHAAPEGDAKAKALRPVRFRQHREIPMHLPEF